MRTDLACLFCIRREREKRKVSLIQPADSRYIRSIETERTLPFADHFFQHSNREIVATSIVSVPQNFLRFPLITAERMKWFAFIRGNISDYRTNDIY